MTKKKGNGEFSFDQDYSDFAQRYWDKPFNAIKAICDVNDKEKEYLNPQEFYDQYLDLYNQMLRVDYIQFGEDEDLDQLKKSRSVDCLLAIIVTIEKEFTERYIQKRKLERRFGDEENPVGD